MAKKDHTKIEDSDFIIRIRPETDTDNEWTGDIDVAIITQPENTLMDDDYSQVMHFCKMLASTIPVMEYNEKFRDLVHDYVMSLKSLDGDYEVELEEKSRIIGEEDNVIQIDFNTRTKGSA
jgi:hypothetical protein|tara:strand:- start:33 stop:395 length:363 start_codon:yes stop_codon:yes gene_type:complete